MIETIPQSDCAKEVKNMDLGSGVLPVERALGVRWDLESDEFVFKIQVKDKPTTRRGLLHKHCVFDLRPVWPHNTFCPVCQNHPNKICAEES